MNTVGGIDVDVVDAILGQEQPIDRRPHGGATLVHDVVVGPADGEGAALIRQRGRDHIDVVHASLAAVRCASGRPAVVAGRSGKLRSVNVTVV